jgi:phenylacetate-CoA ligase
LGKPIFQTGMTLDRGIIKTAKDLITRTKYMNAFRIGEKDVLKNLHKIEGKSNYHLGGFASSLYVIAEVARKHNLRIHFDGAISWGDKLFNHYKNAVEDVFKTKVFENYALNEGFMVAAKKDLPYYYIYTPNIYLELLDKNGNEVPEGEMGHVVLTKLDGYAMPLIRYYTGDLAVKLPKNKYPQKREMAFPLLERVIGRDTDLIKTPDGNILIVHTFTGIFEFFPEIEQFKVIQHELNSITIEYIPSKLFKSEILNSIRKEVYELTGTGIEIYFKEVDHISPTRSGKPQIIESTLLGNTFS